MRMVERTALGISSSIRGLSDVVYMIDYEKEKLTSFKALSGGKFVWFVVGSFHLFKEDIKPFEKFFQEICRVRNDIFHTMDMGVNIILS